MPNHILKNVEGFVKPGNNLFYFKPEKIKIVPGWNGRTDFSDLEELKSSIKEVGVLDPLIVRKTSENMIELVAGERRLRSVLELNKDGCSIASVPVIVRSSRINKIDLYIESVTENTGKPLAPIEEANSFKRLIAWGLTRQEISIKCGRSISHVRNRLELSDAVPAVKKAVQEKAITAGSAQKIVKESGGSVEKQVEKLEEVKAEPKKKVEPDSSYDEYLTNLTPEKRIEKHPEKKIKIKPDLYKLKIIAFRMHKFCGDNEFEEMTPIDISSDLIGLLFENEDQFQLEYNACKDKL